VPGRSPAVPSTPCRTFGFTIDAVGEGGRLASVVSV